MPDVASLIDLVGQFEVERPLARANHQPMESHVLFAARENAVTVFYSESALEMFACLRALNGLHCDVRDCLTMLGARIADGAWGLK